MSRRGNYRSFYDLIKLLIVVTVGIITVIWQFLSKVHRYNKWADVEEKIEFPLKQANKYGRRLDW